MATWRCIVPRQTGTGTGNAKELTYNGVAYTTAAVQNGQYTFWAYEHLAFNTSASAPIQTFAENLAAQIKDVDASTSGIILSSMNVSRTSDGGSVGY